MSNNWNSTVVNHAEHISELINDGLIGVSLIYKGNLDHVDEEEFPEDKQLLCESYAILNGDQLVFSVPKNTEIDGAELIAIMDTSGIRVKFQMDVISIIDMEESINITSKIPESVVKMQKREYQRFSVKDWGFSIKAKGVDDTIRGEVVDLSFSGFQIRTKSKVDISKLENVSVTLNPNPRDYTTKEIVCFASAMRRREIDNFVYIGFNIQGFNRGDDRKFSIAIMGAERALIKALQSD